MTKTPKWTTLDVAADAYMAGLLKPAPLDLLPRKRTTLQKETGPSLRRWLQYGFTDGQLVYVVKSMGRFHCFTA